MLLEPRGSQRTLLKSTFNAENFIRSMSGGPVISTHFILRCVVSLPEIAKKSSKPPFCGFKIVQGHVVTTGKLVSSASYDN